MGIAKIGESIESKRRLFGFTKDDLAEKAGVSRLSIIKLENGEGEDVALGTVIDILEALDLDLDVVPQTIIKQWNFDTSEDYEEASRLFFEEWGLNDERR